jgi:plastocyanin
MAMDTRRYLRSGIAAGGLCLVAVFVVRAQEHPPVTLQVEVVRHAATKQSPAGAHDYSNVAVWLTPADGADPAADSATARSNHQNFQIVQRNKTFEPHVLVVPVGSIVQFPNKDPFFHNVFSLFNGKRFDLGLYEGGASNSARFDHVGMSFLFCNIHPEMSAVVIVVDTRYFALSDREGRVSLANVPDGRYRMHVWYERSSAEELKKLESEIVVSDSTRALVALQVVESGDFKLAHKNKYGQDYTPVANSSYGRP